MLSRSLLTPGQIFTEKIYPLISVLLHFTLSVKAATLIFISGCASAISSAKEGKSGSIYCNLIRFELNSFIIEKSHFNLIGWQTLKKRTLVSYIY